jgi:hypothetical protein
MPERPFAEVTQRLHPVSPGRADADQIPLNIRQAQHSDHQTAGAGRGVGPSFGQGPELPTHPHPNT